MEWRTFSGAVEAPDPIPASWEDFGVAAEVYGCYRGWARGTWSRSRSRCCCRAALIPSSSKNCRKTVGPRCRWPWRCNPDGRRGTWGSCRLACCRLPRQIVSSKKKIRKSHDISKYAKFLELLNKWKLILHFYRLKKHVILKLIITGFAKYNNSSKLKKIVTKEKFFDMIYYSLFTLRREKLGCVNSLFHTHVCTLTHTHTEWERH